jgi:hypothetical protein
MHLTVSFMSHSTVRRYIVESLTVSLDNPRRYFRVGKDTCETCFTVVKYVAVTDWESQIFIVAVLVKFKVTSWRMAQIFFGAFAKLRTATICFVMSVCPSVRPHGTTRLPRYGFSWNFKFDISLFLTTGVLHSDSLCLLSSISLACHKVCNFPDILPLFVECQIF